MRLEIGNLMNGMHARIGPAGTCQLYFTAGYSFERRFDRLLYGFGILLKLPSRIMRPIIPYDKLYITR
jgi:hypothetical protein